MDKWTHLGDGLYIRYDGYQLVLRANNPEDESQPTVYMDDNVLMNFENYIKRLEKENPRL